MAYSTSTQTTTAQIFLPTSSTPLAPTTATPQRTAQTPLEAELQTAREHARRLTTMFGFGAREVAIAWDVVEELLAARAEQRRNQRTAFEQYCADNPEAIEARMYDV